MLFSLSWTGLSECLVVALRISITVRASTSTVPESTPPLSPRYDLVPFVLDLYRKSSECRLSDEEGTEPASGCGDRGWILSEQNFEYNLRARVLEAKSNSNQEQHHLQLIGDMQAELRDKGFVLASKKAIDCIYQKHLSDSAGGGYPIHGSSPVADALIKRHGLFHFLEHKLKNKGVGQESMNQNMIDSGADSCDAMLNAARNAYTRLLTIIQPDNFESVGDGKARFIWFHRTVTESTDITGDKPEVQSLHVYNFHKDPSSLVLAAWWPDRAAENCADEKKKYKQLALLNRKFTETVTTSRRKGSSSSSHHSLGDPTKTSDVNDSDMYTYNAKSQTCIPIEQNLVGKLQGSSATVTNYATINTVAHNNGLYITPGDSNEYVLFFVRGSCVSHRGRSKGIKLRFAYREFQWWEEVREED